MRAASRLRSAARLSWLGHSTVLVDLDGIRLLTDPVLRSRVAHLRRRGQRVDAAQHSNIDAVLISHLHFDHLDPRRAAEALRLLRPLLAVPIHWGTYAPLGFGRLQTALLADPVTAFRRHAAELAPEVNVQVLGPGEMLRLDEITGGATS